MSKIFSFISILVFVATSLTAQQTISSPIKALIDLKEGVLIVRLTSEFRKLKAIEEAAFVSLESTREIIQKRDAENKLWRRHFKRYYSFSDVLFAYDTLRKEALWNHDGKNCFLGEDMKIDSSLSLNGRSYLMLYKGTVSNSQSAVIFRDANFNEVERPFPFYVKINSLSHIYNSLFNSFNADDINIARIVRKIDRKLRKFLEEKGGIHAVP